jgi:hypothetical protein
MRVVSEKLVAPTKAQRSMSMRQLLRMESWLSTLTGHLRFETFWEIGTSFKVTGETVLARH